MKKIIAVFLLLILIASTSLIILKEYNTQNDRNELKNHDIYVVTHVNDDLEPEIIRLNELREMKTTTSKEHEPGTKEVKFSYIYTDKSNTSSEKKTKKKLKPKLRKELDKTKKQTKSTKSS